MALVAIKIGRREDGPSRTGGWRARIWIDTQPMSNAPADLFSSQPFRAAAGWQFFRVARSSRIHSDARRSCLEKQPTDVPRKPCYLRERTLDSEDRNMG
jgi:hypothetical protein